MKRGIATLLFLTFVLSGCSGLFNSDRKYYQFDHTQGDLWVQEIAFIVLTAVPTYDLTVLSDEVVFNSVNLWTGKKPSAKKGVKPLMIGQGQKGAALLLFDNAQEKISLQIIQGQSISELTFVATPAGVIAQDAQGEVHFSATTNSDGSLSIFDREQRLLKSFTAEQVTASSKKQD